MKTYDVIVVGAGLAGLACAYELVAKDKKVLLLEGREVVGGRTSSWNEKGMQVESGLHRYLGFYKALPELLRNCGVSLDEIIYWEDEVEIRLPDDGPNAVYGAAPLSNLGGTIAGLLGNNHMLNWRDKFQLGKLFAAGITDFARDKTALDKISVYDYAKQNGVSDKVIQRLLEPFSTGIFFLLPQEYSAFNFFGLFIPFLPRIYAMRVGAFRGGMTEVLCQPIAQRISMLGGEVITNRMVESLVLTNGKVTGVRGEGFEYKARHVVLATTLSAAQKLISKAGLQGAFRDMLRLESMPAVTVQLELTKPSLPIDRTTFSPGTSWCSYAEQSRSTFTNKQGRLSLILADPKKYLNLPPEEILRIVIADGKRLGIELEDKLSDYRVIYQPQDFYSLSLNNEKLRPAQKTQIPGLSLAGDYTKQDHLSTMEGAVVSGQIAAKHVLAE